MPRRRARPLHFSMNFPTFNRIIPVAVANEPQQEQDEVPDSLNILLPEFIFGPFQQRDCCNTILLSELDLKATMFTSIEAEIKGQLFMKFTEVGGFGRCIHPEDNLRQMKLPDDNYIFICISCFKTYCNLNCYFAKLNITDRQNVHEITFPSIQGLDQEVNEFSESDSGSNSLNLRQTPEGTAQVNPGTSGSSTDYSELIVNGTDDPDPDIPSTSVRYFGTPNFDFDMFKGFSIPD